MKINEKLLADFEKSFDATAPEAASPPARVTAFGEISMIIEFDGPPELSGLVFKRLPIFDDVDSAEKWNEICDSYLEVLGGDVGISLPETRGLVTGKPGAPVVFYTIQQKLPAENICSTIIKKCSPDGAAGIFAEILAANLRVWDFNRDNDKSLEIALDSQVSNWAVQNQTAGKTEPPPDPSLVFIDTSTPFIRENGRELMNAETLLKSVPSFLVWLVRLAFLKDVVARYYDMRRNVIDIIANLYKEGRADLVEPWVEQANLFFAGPARRHLIRPIKTDEVSSYYRFDAFIWSLFLRLRKLDRFIKTRLLGRPYHFLLPEKIERNRV